VKPSRYLIVNADDLGQSPGINRGIMQAHERGIVTSASLMVRREAASQAVAMTREYPDLSLGLHLDLGEWAYRDGWVAYYQVVPVDDARAVADEVKRQLGIFRALVHGNPTHLDSHQHVHRDEPVRSIMLELASELGVPLRNFSPPVRYEGGFYGQTGQGEPLPDVISVDGLAKLLAAISPGITEMGCHPGLGDELDTMYGRERAEELCVLCAPEVRALLRAEQIELASFRDVIAQKDIRGG
jgi:chitin disaccharide deacetylase